MANFNTPYNLERDGQIEFFDNFGIPYDDDNSVLVDYTDGVYNGNILEFKKDIQNTNEVLFQAIKYLSKMRVHGESVPATIILVDLNSTLAYVFHSSDLLLYYFVHPGLIASPANAPRKSTSSCKGSIVPFHVEQSTW